MLSLLYRHSSGNHVMEIKFYHNGYLHHPTTCNIANHRKLKVNYKVETIYINDQVHTHGSHTAIALIQNTHESTIDKQQAFCVNSVFISIPMHQT